MAASNLAELFELEWLVEMKECVKGRMAVTQERLAPHGYLHAASVVAIADSAAAYACLFNLPESASSFTTIELKANMIGTARDGHVTATTKALHIGRSTHVYDAEVKHEETGKTIAHFRCTQMILYPKSS